MRLFEDTQVLKPKVASAPLNHQKKLIKPFALNLDLNVLSKYRALFHIAFWVLLFFYEGIVWGSVDGPYSKRLFSSMVEAPVKIAATYFTLYYLLDKFLLRKKYLQFTILMLISMAVFGTLIRLVAIHFIYPIYCPECLSISLFFIPKILIGIFAIYSIVAIAASFHLIRTWYTHQQSAQKLQQAAEILEKEKLSAELKLLKSQINPHFLFNTLNNLYVLTLNGSSKSPEMVYMLSQLMSYMLYDSNQSEVAITKEIEYIKNYIALEKLRHDERLEVSFNIYGDMKGIKVAPLLLLAFVENCFKHGVNTHIYKAWVNIDILRNENQLVIKIENNKGPQKKPLNGVSGKGIENVKKRLDLIYKGRYNLQFFDEDDNYLVVLKLDLNPELINEVEEPQALFDENSK